MCGIQLANNRSDLIILPLLSFVTEQLTARTGMATVCQICANQVVFFPCCWTLISLLPTRVRSSSETKISYFPYFSVPQPNNLSPSPIIIARFLRFIFILNTRKTLALTSLKIQQPWWRLAVDSPPPSAEPLLFKLNEIKNQPKGVKLLNRSPNRLMRLSHRRKHTIQKERGTQIVWRGWGAKEKETQESHDPCWKICSLSSEKCGYGQSC